MKYRNLGHTDIKVSELGLGGGNFGRKRADLDCTETAVHSWVDRAYDAGINLIDLAAVYPGPASADTFGLAERIFGSWIQKNPHKRSKMVVATKVIGPPRPGVNETWIRNGRKNFTAQDIIDSCNESLQRLNTDYIDLFQLHWPLRSSPAFGCIPFDRQDPIDIIDLHEQLQGFDRLVRDGKVRAIGVCNETCYGVHELVSLAKQHGYTQIASVQNQHSLNDRSIQNGLHETTYRLGVGIIGYSPLCFGLLTGKYDNDQATSPWNVDQGRMSHVNPNYLENRRRYWASESTFSASFKYNQLAKKHGLTPTQLALGYCKQSWYISSTLIGTTNLTQLEENIRSYDTDLDQNILDQINKIHQEIKDPAF